eukprot:366436-Chlamydomonas_euryale.AAC.34
MCCNAAEGSAAGSPRLATPPPQVGCSFRQLWTRHLSRRNTRWALGTRQLPTRQLPRPLSRCRCGCVATPQAQYFPRLKACETLAAVLKIDRRWLSSAHRLRGGRAAPAGRRDGPACRRLNF